MWSFNEQLTCLCLVAMKSTCSQQRNSWTCTRTQATTVFVCSEQTWHNLISGLLDGFDRASLAVKEIFKLFFNIILKCQIVSFNPFYPLLMNFFHCLFAVLFHNAIPFIGFGFLDNAIMIAAVSEVFYTAMSLISQESLACKKNTDFLK